MAQQLQREAKLPPTLLIKAWGYHPPSLMAKLHLHLSGTLDAFTSFLYLLICNSQQLTFIKTKFLTW